MSDIFLTSQIVLNRVLEYSSQIQVNNLKMTKHNKIDVQPRAKNYHTVEPIS